METKQTWFFAYTKGKLDRIDDISSADLKVHKKILYVAFIDSLSGLVYPAHSQNRERFTEVVLTFGKWNDAGKVSTPHLARALRINPDPSYDKVRDLVLQNLDSWSAGDLIPLSRDLDAGVIGSHWPQGKRYEQPVEGAPWNHLKHVELLYAYRNALVHSFRPLGPDAEMPEDATPYYLSTHDATSGGRGSEEFHWQLIYPTVFLRTLAHDIFEAVEGHIRKNSIDPIEVLRGGKYWIRELNK